MFKSILVPLDLENEDESKTIFASALEIARNTGARLNVLTVVPSFSMPMVASFFPPDFEKKALAGALTSLTDFVSALDGADMIDKTLVGHGSVYKEIVGAAEEIKADVIVLGQAAQSPGITCSDTMRRALCGTLIVL